MWRSVLVVLAATASAAADSKDDDASTARALFERGRALVREGSHKEACPVFEKSLALAPALGTELNLALCWVEVGRLVDAMRALEALIPKTVEARQPQREAVAREAVAVLRARLPRLQLELGSLPPTTRVRIDDVEVDTAKPVPIDPGPHRVEADGAIAETVHVVEGRVTTVALRANRRWWQDRRRSWIVGGAGATILVAGAITGISVIRSRDDGLSHCERDPLGELVCEPRGIELLDSARTRSHVTTVLFVAGAALGATAVVLRIRDQRRARKDRPLATAWIAPAGFGVAMEAAW